MEREREFFSEVRLDGLSLAACKRSTCRLQDRNLLKDFLEYIHIKKGLLAPYGPGYPLIELRELLPSFEKNFSEYQDLPSFSLVAFNRRISYQEEIFQFDLLHPPEEVKKRARGNLDKILPHLDRDRRTKLRQRFSSRDLTDLAHYEELMEFLFHMDRAQVIAKDGQGDFRLLGVYASFPSDLDTEMKHFGHCLGKFKKLDSATYEREREFVYQFLMELYGFPIAAERRTSAALFARKLSRLKEQYLIKVLGSSDRTITSLCGFDQKRYPLVEKVALISLPAGLAEVTPHLQDQGFYVDPSRRVVILKVTYQQHKYNRFNVLEDRAMSVLKQELIHPDDGRRDGSLNLLKDSRRTLKDLTDIIRGEYTGSISYKRTDLLTVTKTHEDRLKFLSAWLVKNQHRLAAYGPESFDAAKKLLNSYLLNREHREAFAKYAELHQEVLQRVTYLTQAHRLQPLEKLSQAGESRRGAPPTQRLALALAFLKEVKEELPYFYPELFDKCLKLWDQVVSLPYFKKLAAETAPPNASFRHRVWQMLVRGEELVREIRKAHCQIRVGVRQGTPLPLYLPAPGVSPPS